MRKLLLLVPVVALALAVTAADASAQDINASPTYGQVSLSSGFAPDPHSINLTAGGGVPMGVSSSCSYGMVATAPDYQLFYQAGNTFPLYVYATSESDITLLVNLPNGTWACDDDGFTGLNPLLYFGTPMSGRYDIWVGTYGDAPAPATLYISELNPGD